MNCPYCKNEMRKGALCTAVNVAPYWEEAETKRGLMGALANQGTLPATQARGTYRVEAYYCTSCKKMIIDADLHL